MGNLVASNNHEQQTQHDEGANRVLSFVVGGESYALSILKVKEIIEYDHITPVPMMPPFILGAINLRDQVVPVVDLAQRLGGSKSEVSRRSCIILVEVAASNGVQNIGLLVDAVSQVRDFEPTQLEAAPSLGGQIRTDFISAMGKLEDGRFVILLDIDKILSLEDLALLAMAKNTGATSE